MLVHAPLQERHIDAPQRLLLRLVEADLHAARHRWGCVVPTRVLPTHGGEVVGRLIVHEGVRFEQVLDVREVGGEIGLVGCERGGDHCCGGSFLVVAV